MIYAVIDTNVLLSALITKNPEAATAKVVRLLLDARGQVSDIILFHKQPNFGTAKTKKC